MIENDENKIYIKNEIGTFVLNREYSEFEIKIKWNDMDANVHLKTDQENGETAENSMKVLRELLKDTAYYDMKFRRYAAQELRELTKIWMYEPDDINARALSEEEFIMNMKINDIDIRSRGNLILYYSDNGMFAGHSIIVDVYENGNFSRAYF